MFRLFQNGAMVSSPGYIQEYSNAWYRQEEQQAQDQQIVDWVEIYEGDDDYEAVIAKAREEAAKKYGVGPGPLPIIDLRQEETDSASSQQRWPGEEVQGCKLLAYGPQQERMGDRLSEAREIRKLERTKNFEAKRKTWTRKKGAGLM